MNLVKISKRTFAYVVLKVSATLGGGFVVGVELWQAAAVLDGNVSDDDVNGIFGEFLTDEDPELGK